MSGLLPLQPLHAFSHGQGKIFIFFYWEKMYPEQVLNRLKGYDTLPYHLRFTSWSLLNLPSPGTPDSVISKKFTLSQEPEAFTYSASFFTLKIRTAFSPKRCHPIYECTRPHTPSDASIVITPAALYKQNLSVS